MDNELFNDEFCAAIVQDYTTVCIKISSRDVFNIDNYIRWFWAPNLHNENNLWMIVRHWRKLRSHLKIENCNYISSQLVFLLHIASNKSIFVEHRIFFSEI